MSMPRSTSQDRTAGAASASTAAALSLPMMSFGVPLGAKSAYQPEKASTGRPISPSVGMSAAIAHAGVVCHRMGFDAPSPTSGSPPGGPKKRSARPPNPENAGEVLEAEPQLTLTKLRARAMMIGSKVWDEYAVALRIAGIPD